MKIVNLLSGVKYDILCGDVQTDIKGISRSSNKVVKDGLFFCIRGLHSDGHTYANDAVSKGARALVVDKNILDTLEDTKDITVILVDDVRVNMALISANFYENAHKRLKTIALVGTKGKTTTACMVKAVLDAAGYKCGLIGTIKINDGNQETNADFTTPESDDLHRYIYQMYKNNCKFVVMEVSSQAYQMHRSDGINFDIAIFTNISPDHIGAGEHKDFEDYFSCKQGLLKQAKFLIYNKDADLCDKMIAPIKVPMMSFAVDNMADVRAEKVSLIKKTDSLGVKFTVQSQSFELQLPGEFNVHNALAAICVGKHFGIDFETISKALANTKVAGRMEMVKVGDNFSVFIDYAHNAMSLESALTVLRKYKPARLVCLFGCGGNRDRNRRFQMGEISGKMADLTIATSDNPRFEEPEAIVDDIIEGIKKTDGKYIKIVDRIEAISYALNNAKAGDVILLAGKGHETYQEIKGIKHDMDERDIVEEIRKCMLG